MQSFVSCTDSDPDPERVQMRIRALGLKKIYQLTLIFRFFQFDIIMGKVPFVPKKFGAIAGSTFLSGSNQSDVC